MFVISHSVFCASITKSTKEKKNKAVSDDRIQQECERNEADKNKHNGAQIDSIWRFMNGPSKVSNSTHKRHTLVINGGRAIVNLQVYFKPINTYYLCYEWDYPHFLIFIGRIIDIVDFEFTIFFLSRFTREETHDWKVPSSVQNCQRQNDVPVNKQHL